MPMVDRITAITNGRLFGFFFVGSSTFMYKEVSTGLITKATNKEEERTMIRVMGRNFINSPMISSQNASGKKADTVVNVEVIIGQATSPTPSFAARIGDFPSDINR